MKVFLTESMINIIEGKLPNLGRKHKQTNKACTFGK